MLDAKTALAGAREYLPNMTALLREVVLINSHTAHKAGVGRGGPGVQPGTERAGA